VSGNEYEVERIAEFDRQAKRFVKKKKYFSLPGQIDELIDKFEKGEFDGTIIKHMDVPTPYDIYKMRLPCPDTDAGKSDGYRVIYMVVTEKSIVALLIIYHKKEDATVSDNYILGVADGYLLGSVSGDDDV